MAACSRFTGRQGDLSVACNLAWVAAGISYPLASGHFFAGTLFRVTVCALQQWIEQRSFHHAYFGVSIAACRVWLRRFPGLWGALA